MNKFMSIGAIAILVGGFAVSAHLINSKADSDAGGEPIVAVTLPAELSQLASSGRTKFNENCAACHGTNAAGRQGIAPPLVHIIYEPNHHGDESFQRAAAQGVRQHHWPFGNMPPINDLNRDDVQSIIAYVRELQRENGIN